MTGHILFIRWCFYLIPYYLLKSLSSCRKDAQKSHAQSSRTTHILLFPFFSKYSSKEWTLKISTTTLVQHRDLTVLVLTRVLQGEMHCWFYPWLGAKLPSFLGSKVEVTLNCTVARWKDGFNILLVVLSWKLYCTTFSEPTHLPVGQCASITRLEMKAWTYLTITASITYVPSTAQLTWCGRAVKINCKAAIQEGSELRPWSCGLAQVRHLWSFLLGFSEIW